LFLDFPPCSLDSEPQLCIEFIQARNIGLSLCDCGTPLWADVAKWAAHLPTESVKRWLRLSKPGHYQKNPA
jgi:hypothetical protein